MASHEGQRVKRLAVWSVAGFVALAVVIFGGLIKATRSDVPANDSKSVNTPAGAPPSSTSPMTSVAPSVGEPTPSEASKSARSPTPSTSPVLDDPDQTRVHLDALASRDVGRQRFADVFGGLAFSNFERHIEVYLTVLDPQVEAGIIGDADPSEFSFHLTITSEAQQVALRDRIATDWQSLAAQGIDVVEIGPVLETGKVRIGVGTLTPQIQQTLEDLYGAAYITVTEIPPDQLPVAL